MAVDLIPTDDILENEARAFSRYLVDRDPPPEIIARYVAANRALFSEVNDDSEKKLVAFVRRHEWTMPFVDAIVGLVRPNALLRRKMLVTAAILEASPHFVDAFLPRPSSPVAWVLELGVCGIGAVLKMAIGLLLRPAVGRVHQ